MAVMTEKQSQVFEHVFGLLRAKGVLSRAEIAGAISDARGKNLGRRGLDWWIAKLVDSGDVARGRRDTYHLVETAPVEQWRALALEFTLTAIRPVRRSVESKRKPGTQETYWDWPAHTPGSLACFYVDATHKYIPAEEFKHALQTLEAQGYAEILEYDGAHYTTTKAGVQMLRLLS